MACVGITLCLNTPTSSDSTLGNALYLANSISGTGSAEAASSLPPAPIASPLVRGGATEAAPPQIGTVSGEQLSLQFIKPVEGFPLTSGFGNRIHPISGDVRLHKGIDFGTPTGTPIRASKQGVVTFSDWKGGYGKTVIIHHAADYETLYAHLDELLVKAGDSVAQGEVIGLSGSTGYSTGPHLHFEIRANQVAHNPLDYLPATGAAHAIGNRL